MILTASIICFMLALVCAWLAGRFSAIQDTVIHHPDGSVYNKSELYHTKIFGIDYEYWYNLNRKHSSLAKYKNYNKSDGLRKTKILWLKLHLIQLYDAWHWFKMWKIAMYNLSDVFSSAGALLLLVHLVFVSSFGLWDAALLIGIVLFCYWWLNGGTWILSFNKHYDVWLVK